MKDNIPGIAGIGKLTAARLLQHFGSVENVYSKLGLLAIPPPPEDIQVLPSNSKDIRKYLKSIMSPDIYANALKELQICIGNVTKSETVLVRLYLCGYENVLLYKKLVTLIDGLNPRDILMENSRFISPDIIKSDKNTKDIMHSDFFRYTGESRHARNEVEEFFMSINPMLLQPLRLLRQQYHKL